MAEELKDEVLLLLHVSLRQTPRGPQRDLWKLSGKFPKVRHTLFKGIHEHKCDNVYESWAPEVLRNEGTHSINNDKSWVNGLLNADICLNVCSVMGVSHDSVQTTLPPPTSPCLRLGVVHSDSYRWFGVTMATLMFSLNRNVVFWKVVYMHTVSLYCKIM